MKTTIILLFTLVALIVCACACANKNKPIGDATMEKDGTIVLHLRAESDDGFVGHSYFRYEPSHPKYQEILSHLGGLKPGENKLVLPWPKKRKPNGDE